VLEDLMKIYEVIALEHVGTMIKLMKMWRFDVSRVDQASCVCYIWITREENKLEEKNLLCRPFSIV